MRDVAASLLLLLIMEGPAFAQVSSFGPGQHDPRLSGIVVSPEQRVAIFTFDRIGVSAIAGEGATIGRWTIVSINAHSVEVATVDGRQLVSIDAIAEADTRPRALASATPQRPSTDDAMFGPPAR